jgi:hypothetical protein
VAIAGDGERRGGVSDLYIARCFPVDFGPDKASSYFTKATATTTHGAGGGGGLIRRNSNNVGLFPIQMYRMLHTNVDAGGGQMCTPDEPSFMIDLLLFDTSF